MKKQYMLDTNIVSHLLKKQPLVLIHMLKIPMKQLCISSITAGELMYGLAKRPNAVKLKHVVIEFLRCVEILPWECMRTYGDLRAEMELQGTPLGSLDMLIAAHALDIKAILVTNDQAFTRVSGLEIEDWTV